MKILIIIILFITSWQSVYCDKEYGNTFFAKLNNGLTLDIKLFNNSKYYIYVEQRKGFDLFMQCEFSLGRYIKKKDSIIFIDEVSNYSFFGVFVPSYPLGQTDLEIHINNKGDFFKTHKKLICLKSYYDYYKNQLKEIKKMQKERSKLFVSAEKKLDKETYMLDYSDYIFINCMNENDIILRINKDNSYSYSLYGSVLSEGKFKRKGNAVYLIDNQTKEEYKVVVISNNELSAVKLPLFSSLNSNGKLSNETQSEKKQKANGFFRK